MPKNFGDILKSIRIDRGMTQEEFAALLDTTKQVISRYENGQRTPKVTVAKEYADILNVPLSVLLGDDEESSSLVNNDAELTQYLEELKNRKEMRMLFSLAAGATKEDVERTVKIVEAALGKQAKDE